MVTIKFCVIISCICFFAGVAVALFLLGITSLAEKTFPEINFEEQKEQRERQEAEE